MIVWRLEQQRDFTAPALDALLRETAEKFELKLRQLLAPLFVALSGRTAWTPLFDSMEILARIWCGCGFAGQSMCWAGFPRKGRRNWTKNTQRCSAAGLKGPGL